MEDVDDQTSIQDDAEGPEFHRAGARTAIQVRRRQPPWQWNRINEGGLYNPRRIVFSGNEGIQVPLPANAMAEDSSNFIFMKVLLIICLEKQICIHSSTLQKKGIT